MKTLQYKPEQFIEAIQESDGILVVACRALGCSTATFYRYAERFPEVQEAYDKAKDKTDRAVANKLMEIAFNDGHKDQLSALKYYTACKLGWRVGHDITSAGKQIAMMKWTDDEE